MRAILIHVTEAEADALADAADAAGMSRKQYIRRAAVSAASNRREIAEMVAEIHDRVCGAGGQHAVYGGPADEPALAVAALVSAGMRETDARRRIAAASAVQPDAGADELVALAMRRPA